MSILTLRTFQKEFKFHINRDAMPLHRLGYHEYNLDFDVYLPSRGMNLQRALVWTDFQKQQFIISILKGNPIPKITLIEHHHDDKKNRVYQVIDGKQRITTYLAFIKNEFPIIVDDIEYFFKDLCEDLKYEINVRFTFRGDLGYSYYDKPISDEDKIAWFNQINFAGTPQDLEHMNKLQGK